MAKTINTEVCIVGAGIVGRVLAWGLAQIGWRVVLVSQEKPIRRLLPHAWDLRVYALNHASRRLLSRLNLWPALDITRIAPIEMMKVSQGYHKGPNARCVDLQFDAYSAYVDALAWIVEDANLHHALAMGCTFASCLQEVVGRSVQLTINEHHVRLVLDEGITIQTRLLVGADGAASWVRTQAHMGVDYRSYQQDAIVMSLLCDKPHHDTAYQWFLADEGIVALLPLPGKAMSLVWSAPHVFCVDPQAHTIAARLTVLARESLGVLTPLSEHVLCFPLTYCRATSMVAPRVALIGDAAHVVHPLAGQGMNMGLADVAQLLEILNPLSASYAHHAMDCGDARLLARYARRRSEAVALMSLTTDGLQRLFEINTLPVSWIRSLGMRLVDGLPVVKRHLIQQALG